MRGSDIWIEDSANAEYVVFHCPVFKKRFGKIHSREVVARLDESWFVDPILAWKQNKEDRVLFPHHRATAYRWLVKETGFNPHFFRKLRATHLATKHSFTDQQLVRFFEWSNSVPAAIYTKLNMEDIKY
jgi:hypothetical protein